MIKIQKILTILVLKIFLCGFVSAQCQPELVECEPGNTANGGYYPVNEKICSDGVICDLNQAVCKKGLYGDGGCYRPNDDSCVFGKICPNLTGIVRYCPPGIYGKGGCYKTLICFGGAICPGNEETCPKIAYDKYRESLARRMEGQ
ncbi:unnamed protein product [Brachionus calyciflorus]|uniref:Uncharacterized protein n=1 Tax=Brachionus calyciflorus TaxID=104777 RepID=A0A814HSB8_9BILA|nr:unnamed protein product [Brachionus calyciflorus]